MPRQTSRVERMTQNGKSLSLSPLTPTASDVICIAIKEGIFHVAKKCMRRDGGKVPSRYLQII